MARLPALGLAVFHLYDSADSPMTLRSDTLLRIPGRGQSIRGLDPLPVRSQTVDAQPLYIQSQSLSLGFSGTTGLLEVRGFLCFCCVRKWSEKWFRIMYVIVLWSLNPLVAFKIIHYFYLCCQNSIDIVYCVYMLADIGYLNVHLSILHLNDFFCHLKLILSN